MMCGLAFLHFLQKKNHHLSSQDLLHLISAPLFIVAVPCAFTHALRGEQVRTIVLHPKQGLCLASVPQSL